MQGCQAHSTRQGEALTKDVSHTQKLAGCCKDFCKSNKVKPYTSNLELHSFERLVAAAVLLCSLHVLFQRKEFMSVN